MTADTLCPPWLTGLLSLRHSPRRGPGGASDTFNTTRAPFELFSRKEGVHTQREPCEKAIEIARAPRQAAHVQFRRGGWDLGAASYCDAFHARLEYTRKL